jgi:hypothetical protein
LVQGSTRAQFGAGIAVGGAPPGTPGPVIVISPTVAVATLAIDANASAGAREVLVETGAQRLSLPAGFLVEAPAANSPSSVLTLNSAASPAGAHPGAAVSVKAFGLPASPIFNAAQVALLLEPATPNDGVTLFVRASSVAYTEAGSFTVGFEIPNTINLSRPIAYRVSLIATSDNYQSTGITLASANKAELTLNPGAAVISLAPNSAQQGQSVSVLVNGQFTSFAPGATQANFGVGISVGGAPAGQFGPLNVNSPISATASLNIEPGAAPGARTVLVRTGSEQTVLNEGFFVLPGATLLTLSGNTVPAAAAPGAALSVSGSGFPTGNLTQLSVRLEPATPGAGAAVVVPATANPATGTNRNVSFVVPANLSVLSLTPYLVSVSGTANNGVQFTSSNKAAFTLNPPPSLLSVQPNAGRAGESVAVRISGRFTTFVSGDTTVDFGAGITASNVVVESPTSLTATLAIAANAASGARDLSVRTGTQVVLLSAAFSVTAGDLPIVLESSTSPAAAIPGSTVGVGGTGYPEGPINPSQVQVTLRPASGGTALTVNATSVAAINSNNRIVAFSLPASLSLSAPTAYLVSLRGLGVSGLSFASTNQAQLTINPLPRLLSSTPATANAGATVSVTLRGQFTNFQNTVTQASYGPGVAVGGAPEGSFGPVTVSDATTAVAQLRIAGNAAIGPRDINVRTGNESVQLPQGFAIGAGAPRLLSLAPSSGKAGESVGVQLRGQFTNFVSGQTQLSLGAGITVSNINVLSPTLLNAILNITPNAAPGARTASVQTGAEQLSLDNAFVVLGGVPEITLVSPNSGRQGQTLDVNITGRNTAFMAGQSQVSFGEGIFVRGVQVSSPTALRATLEISPTATLGARELTIVTGAQSASLANAFSVTGGEPTLLSVTPSSATPGQSLALNITAQFSAFSQGQTQVSLGAGITVSTVTVNSPTSLTAQITVAANAVGGPRALTVTTGVQVLSRASAFTVQGPAQITSVTPGSGAPGQNLLVTVAASGSSFAAGATQVSFGAGITVGAVTVNSPVSLLVPISISSAASPGTRTVSVTTGAQTLTRDGAFTVSGAVATPSLLSVSPASSLQGRSLDISIAGRNTSFVQGQSQVSLGAGISVDSVTVASPTALLARISVAANAAVGPRLVSVTTAGQAITLADGFTVLAPPIDISFTLPTASALFRDNRISVSGTVADPTAQVVVIGLDKDQATPVNAVVSGNSFSATNVPIREGLNILTVRATNSRGGLGTATLPVILDSSPPQVNIDSPADGAVLTSNVVNVSGFLNDTVTGTINVEQATVFVNGIQARISNRSFEVPDLQLVRGRNTINAVVRDKAGNERSSSISVLVQTDVAQRRLIQVSGNNQSAQIGQTLSEPLVVQMVDSSSNPVADWPLTFTVRRSEGTLKAQGQEGRELTIRSDANGMASLQFTTGKRVGVGINQVEVTAAGVAASAIFSSSTSTGPAKAIKGAGVMGENMVGIIGKPLPMPFIVIVQDEGGNPVGNVPVTFKVELGGGNLAGQVERVVNTDTDGKASVLPTLGPQEGVNNNIVTANIPNNPGLAVVLTASATPEGPASKTTVSGIVLDNQNLPIPNATAKLVGTGLTTLTDAQGRFSLGPAPVGTVVLIVEGQTSTRSEKFPFLAFQLMTIAGQDNTVGMPIFLPTLDEEGYKTVGGSEEVVLTMKGIPGLAYTVFPNSATYPDGSRTGKLGVFQVASDKVPMPPANGSSPPLVATLQPAGVVFDPPVRVQIPNVSGLPAGAVTEIFSFDHDLEQWVSSGTARVSSDGSVVVSDPGAGIKKSGWHFVEIINDTFCLDGCNDNNDCTLDACDSRTGSCSHTPTNLGQRCGDKSNCSADQTCQPNGSCGSTSNPNACTASSGTKCQFPPGELDFCAKENEGKCTPIDGNCSKGLKCDVPTIPDEPAGIATNVSLSLDASNNFIGRGFEKVFSFFGAQFPDASAALNFSITPKKVCCSEKKTYVNNRAYSLTVEAGAGSGDLAAVPIIPFGVLFLSMRFSLSASVGGTLTYDNCQDLWTASAEGSVGGAFDAGLRSNIGLIAKATLAAFTIGVTGTVSISGGKRVSASVAGEITPGYIKAEYCYADAVCVSLLNFNVTPAVPFSNGPQNITQLLVN